MGDQIRKPVKCLIWPILAYLMSSNALDMGTNPAVAANLFVTYIETAYLNSELPDTAVTLLDSYIGLVGIGYQSNYLVSVW